MIKLNNKGFAFSTILYGLMLMGIMIIILILSVMQTNRSTNKGFVEKIEAELNRYSLTETSFSTVSTNDGQEYIVPPGQAGWYKIELFGAQGGGTNGGLGAYTSGYIWLDENAHLYFFIGKSGNTFNGGGSANGGGIGGGSTDVRLVNGTWNDANSLNSRIMVAAGGGGGTNGGAGGTITGLDVSTIKGGLQNDNAAYFGLGRNGGTSPAGGGGGGYYSGSGGSNSGGAGGSSYISGYAGVYTKGTAALVKHSSGLYFVGGVMIPGVKASNGTASITKVSNEAATNPPVNIGNNLFNSVNEIEDCISGSDGDATTNWREIQVINTNGENIAKGKSVLVDDASATGAEAIVDGIINDSNIYTISNGSNHCVRITGLGNDKVSDIAIWHKKGKAPISHSLKINGTLVTKSVGNNVTVVESDNGLHYSKHTPDTMSTNIPDGSYYIMLAGSENLVLTNESNTIKAKLFGDTPNQKWTVLNKGGYYQITLAVNGKSLEFENGDIYDVNNTYNKYILKDLRDIDIQKYYFEVAENGTFRIRHGNANKALGFDSIAAGQLLKYVDSKASGYSDVANGKVGLRQTFKFIPA